MSISVATMGKFWPATSSGNENVVYVDRGSSYIDTRKKVSIHIEKIYYDKYKRKDIKILAVKEE